MYLFCDSSTGRNQNSTGPQFGMRRLSLNALIIAAIVGVLGAFGTTLARYYHLVASLQLLTQ